MRLPTRTDRTAVAAKTESGRLCTVTVQRDPLGQHLLRYEGGENAVAELTPEVIELLTVALSGAVGLRLRPGPRVEAPAISS